jgi:hypothetical protein
MTDEKKLALFRAGATFAFKLALDGEESIEPRLDELFENAPEETTRSVVQEMKNALVDARNGNIDMAGLGDV